MRHKFWSFDTVTFDFEDMDARVLAVHLITGVEVSIMFRLTKSQVSGPSERMREKLETIATDYIMDLSSFLEYPN